MLKILLIKTSSMGDLIHIMPAISDLACHRPDIELHWLVEEGFGDIPLWHPFVKKVHRCGIRRWRRSPLSANHRSEMRLLKHQLRAEQFDCVIDAQGLLKSAWMLRWLKCEKHGYDKNSIKEPLASLFYHHKYSIEWQQSAIVRNRKLLAAVMRYPLPETAPDFALQVSRPDDFSVDVQAPYAVFLHGSNWPSKLWPVPYWRKLAARLAEDGLRVLVAWGSEEEKQRASAIADQLPADVLPRQSLQGMAYILQNAHVVVGCDTGLSHLAAALGSQTIALYGSTSSELTGLVGDHVHSLQAGKDCSPCMLRECPLVKPGEMIPCYASIDDNAVIRAMEQLQ